MQVNTDISLTIDLLGYLLCEGHWTGSSHVHPFWELVIATDDFEAFEAKVFVPNENHRFENRTSRNKHLLYVGFDFKCDAGYTRQEVKEALQVTINDSANRYVYAAFFRQIRVAGELPSDTDFYMQLMVFLTNQLGRYMCHPTEGAPNTALVSDVKKYINANLHQKISIQQLAKAFYITPKHLGQVFKAEVGEGIVQYTKRKKAEKALLLIKTKEYNITQISQMLGYDNIHYFSAVFKGYYGSPPTAFYNN